VKLKPLDPAKLEKKLRKHLPHSIQLCADAEMAQRLAAMTRGLAWCQQRFTKEFVVPVEGVPHYDKHAEWYISHTGFFHFARKKDLRRFAEANEG
jgi:hypothetical protein